MKIILVVGLVLILGALGAAGLFMLRRPRADTAANQDGNRPAGQAMARALAVRVGLSVALFLVILFAYLMGWIHPTGIPLTPH